MWRRRGGVDVKDWIILSLLACLIILYSRSTSSRLPSLPGQHFTPAQKLFDTTYAEWHAAPPSLADVPGSVVSVVPQPSQNPVQESEITLPDGLIAYTRTTVLSPNATLLFLTLTQDAESWGGHDGNDLALRAIQDYLDVLISTDLDINFTSLALWTTSVTQYHLFRTATTRIPFARLLIFLDQNTISSAAPPRSMRHKSKIQFERRARVARLRNTLLLRSLGPEPHHLWLDADITFLSPGIVQRIVSNSESDPRAGIITARCVDNATDNFDRNAWQGVRPGPGGSESADPVIAKWERKQPYRKVAELIRWTSNDKLIPLDTVGGTILYMRASLVWAGLNFPSWYVIGTRWGRNGWDGIETEGLCYAARGMAGGGCYLLGGTHHVRHSNW